MDNDDMIHPDMVKRLYRSVRKNHCDIVCTSAYEITQNRYRAFMHYPIEEDVAVTIDEYLNQHFVKNDMWTMNVWNKLYRASLVKSHLFPVLIADDEAWTPYILSWAEHICWIDGGLYEHDRIIRDSTLFDEWMKQSYEEKFRMHVNAFMFYLEYGNPKRQKLLKELARRELCRWGKFFVGDRAEEVWKEIDEKF